MTTEPTGTATPPTSPSRMPRRSARTARRIVLAGATLVLAGAGVAVAAPANAIEVEPIAWVHVLNACKSPGRSGELPNTYYVNVHLLGSYLPVTYTFTSLSTRGGPALTSITPQQVTLPAHVAGSDVTLLVQGGTNSGYGPATLTSTHSDSVFTGTRTDAISHFHPTHDGTCPVP
jgi:hypothetical protein